MLIIKNLCLAWIQFTFGGFGALEIVTRVLRRGPKLPDAVGGPCF